ncbi:hypothetical protein NPS01_37700 [Nocardioides psychrotolerans]|uniref:Lipoprotein LpqN n=1 Tax=Nocardioides psychrotolerans TaxID=1005945 RepID=A0A1I3QJ22_9ACTN|nr:hypothetical protein [Nocardioides psychrotolerans]GEP40107.1 hypothetical protein NPS01_37700 [Nocardioides psychrotolerans]SFJ33559.1 hypothetical protein SAMN05216561_12545 [Nocardioides psychrotolerans]
MRYSPAHDNTLRRRRILVAAAAAVALLIAASAYAMLSRDNPSSSTSSSSELDVFAPPETAPDVAPTSGVLPELDPTADPESFARLVAHAIFDWDTVVAVPLSDYTNRLVTVADPTGESSPGLVADVAGYLPTATAWSQLRTYATRQWLAIDTAKVPSLWSQAEVEAGPDGFLPGTTAFTITGVRHRAGVWEGDPVASEHDVAFTVFIVCAPSYPDCHLLRLSRLDEPLG